MVFSHACLEKVLLLEFTNSHDEMRKNRLNFELNELKIEKSKLKSKVKALEKAGASQVAIR